MSSPPHRLTWYERQQKRKASPFFRLLRRSFRFRLFLSALIAFTLLGVVNRFETCHARNNQADCIGHDLWSVISVSNIESFSIMTAALLYILEKRQHKQEEHGKAVERLVMNQQMGAVNSLGRMDALELLCEDGIWLDGIDLQGANLEGLSIPGGRLRRVNLSGAVLIDANLQGVDFTSANLAGADLTGADVTGAIFTGADLTGTILENSLPRET
jgi:hypothetical protein